MSADRPDKAFATLRFLGDDLDPGVVTKAVGHEPTLSYRKGETYRAGRRRLGQEIVGRTGLWLLSTEELVGSNLLQDHIDRVTLVLTAPTCRADLVGRMVRDCGYDADASCFWAGSAGSEPPVPQSFRDLIGRIGGTLEVDFVSEDQAADRMAAE